MDLTAFITCHLRTEKHRLVKNTPPGIPFTVPVPAYLLEHKGEYWLFDTGEVPPEVPQKEDTAFYILMEEKDRLSRQLAARNIPPEKIKGILLSHFHSDHIDGVKDFPHTPLYVQKKEAPRLPAFVKRENLHLLDGQIDLFGDNSCILLPTPGHTPGHQSLLLTLSNGEKVLLAVDAAYTYEEFRRGESLSAPENEFDESLLALLRLQKKGVRLVPGHDPFLDYRF